MVSIILPTYNSIRFLEARLKSIINQTLTGWECIVIDGYSSDGSWEMLQEIAASDNRFLLYKYPPKGPYDAWNKGLIHAQGAYVYIATSDDTMSPDCLEKLFVALEEHQDCEIAHCNLTIIDEEGNDLRAKGWDWAKFPPGQYFGEWYHKKHKRIAPHDAILYASLHTIYHSITQLLFRKSLCEKIGYFRTDRGSAADFEWGMRAAFVTNTLHIPEYLATWRVHKKQVTNIDLLYSSEHREMLLKMVEAAYQNKLNNTIKLEDLTHTYLLEMWSFSIKEGKLYSFTLSFLRTIIKNPAYIKNLYYLIRYNNIIGENSVEYANKMVIKYNLMGYLVHI
ncbi:glycosyltransferase involved in cell wall biosynthesis [Catalinimonas alkaloidigena]|uniref:glycosyltransferase n=1 Tax=Catalinimonas alkaloidigena TaxID=1075417 RepID=UPI0024050A81|nr:glycosyltransferase [Catalinimonas alkaloidigena]MDF9795213.1 glycosyltransferase involved in cell wall biosynthesis [Catalinimonas alkaloidigena]